MPVYFNDFGNNLNGRLLAAAKETIRLLSISGNDPVNIAEAREMLERIVNQIEGIK